VNNRSGTTWSHKAKEMPKEGFKYAVEQHLTGIVTQNPKTRQLES
jgi:hypothetical protein